MGKLRPMAVLRIVSVPAAVWAIYYLKGNICFRLYPVAVVAFVFAFFLISLFRTPAVEVFARRMGEAIDDRVKEYCRKVTLQENVDRNLWSTRFILQGNRCIHQEECTKHQ